MASSLATFESELDEQGVGLTRTAETTLPETIADVSRGHTVGVDLAAKFDSDSFSLAETAVSVDPTPVELRDATTGVTGADIGIGDYGSVVLSMSGRASELVSLFVDRHVVVLRESDVLTEMSAGLDALDGEIADTRGSAIIATGPSATADMGELVEGAHGPEAVHVVVVEGGS